MINDFLNNTAPVILSDLAQFFCYEGSSFAVCYPPPCFIQLNHDMREILESFRTPKTIAAVKRECGLDDVADSLFDELLKRRILVAAKGANLASNNLAGSSEHGYYSHLSIFPTYRCNLACKYCYARGGERTEDISDNLIDAVIDYFFSQLDGRNTKHVALDFHGGGEPTLALPQLRYALDRFSIKCSRREVSHHVGMATNACFDAEVLDWIIANNLNLTVSFDGPHDVHNANRPYADGSSSHATVVRNVKALVANGIHFAVRSTVSESSVHRMSEMVDFFASLGVAYLHFEPCFETGRSVDTGTKQPETSVWGAEFLRAFKRALSHGIFLRFSGLRCLDFPSDRFCGACGTNLAVTPDGNLTSCYEVVHKDDPASQVFFVGHVDPSTGMVHVDESKRSRLLARRVSKMAECSSCFMQWTCAGDCPVKAWRSTGSMMRTLRDRCEMITQINMAVVSMILKGDFLPAKHLWRFNYER